MPRLLTPIEKLIHRIMREFPKKKLLGDIAINDDEFQLLVDYFRGKYRHMYISGQHHVIDPILSLALIQIGIRYYDGNFWSHVKRILNARDFNANHQGWLGMTFVETMRQYGKLQLENNRVDSILMHGFVSNYYAENFFNFLFAFYSIDLERDLNRLDRLTMDELVGIIKRNDNTGRTYWLVEHTADAVRNNTRGSKIRIRRYLKLIDKAFWGEQLPENSQNRLVAQFIKWEELSDDFQAERNRYIGSAGQRKKRFSAPFIRYFPRTQVFKLILPAQIVRFQDIEDLHWLITLNGERHNISLNPYECEQGVTGYKTDELSFSLSKDTLFSRISAELINNGTRLRSFKIPDASIRFFDSDGDNLQIESLFPGQVFSFSIPEFLPESEAIIETEHIGNLVCTHFSFMLGDILRLPNCKPISIGRRLQDGLLPRGVVEEAIADSCLPVYAAIPSVFFRTSPKRIPGTAIKVNGKTFRVYDVCGLIRGVTKIDLLDNSNENGYLINLVYFGCNQDGLYDVSIDIPNEYSSRHWRFALIKKLSFRFEDAPYIFKPRGTILLNNVSGFTSNSGVPLEMVDDCCYHNFEIVAGESFLHLSYQGIDVGFEIPALSYKFGEGIWQTAAHIDIWHSSFPSKVYIKYCGNSIKFLLDSDNDESGSCVKAFKKIRSKDLFECDLSPFLSWIGRNKTRYQIYIDLPGNAKPIPFLGVITKSVLLSGVLRGDFQKNRIIGEFNILGMADYYADLFHNGICLAEKVPLTNGLLVIESELESGRYEVHIFETEEDDSGFGDQVFYEIGKKELDLLDPYDLTGKSFAIRSIRPAEDDSSYLLLRCSYRVEFIRLVSNENKHLYQGKMVVFDSSNSILATFKVEVDFFDFDNLEHTYITFYDGEAPTEFLYDESKGRIVKQEERRLTKPQAYRRYKRSLFPEDYIFEIDFIDVDEETEDRDDASYNNLVVCPLLPASVFGAGKPIDTAIEKMGLSIRTYNCLHRARILGSLDISGTTFWGLLKVRNLGRRGIDEIVSKMQSLGYTEWVQAVFREREQLEKNKWR